jgi:TonB family protein
LAGQWKAWHQNGNPMYECVYNEMSYQLFSQVSLNYYGSKDGSFKSWYENGNLESTGFYTNDALEGEWKWFHSNNKQSTIEHYQNGKLTSLQCFDSTGKETGAFCSIDKPALLKEYGDYKQFIFQNLTWPEEAIKKNIEGTVKVHFTVSKNGELKNLVLNSDKEVLKKAVEELFESMKEWYPAISHNRTIDSEEEMEIPFFQNR